MREIPMLFSTPLVQAILSGRKTQTRRPVKWPKWADAERDWPVLVWSSGLVNLKDGRVVNVMRAPCAVGDLLYVRETWAWPGEEQVIYRADEWAEKFVRDSNANQLGPTIRWCPSIHMPRRFARIWLRVTDVRVERVQDISEEDARAEGFDRREHFIRSWDEIYAAGGLSFDASPWVWRIAFERCETPAREGGR